MNPSLPIPSHSFHPFSVPRYSFIFLLSIRLFILSCVLLMGSFIRTEALGFDFSKASNSSLEFDSSVEESSKEFFDGVSITGSGFIRAKLMKKSCFKIAAKDKSGKILDEGYKQKTFFVVFLKSEYDKIRMMANVKYMKSKSVHKVCYRIPSSGVYTLKIFLLFFDAYKIRNRIQKKITFNAYQKNFLVAKSRIVVKETTLGPTRDDLPVCTLALLSASNNEGYWKQNQWMPQACNALKIFPKNIKKCLKGNRILMIGDSQMRGTFSEFVNFFRFQTRCKYLKILNQSKDHTTRIFSFGKRMKRMDVVTNNPNVVVTKTSFGPNWEVVFFGTFWDGFAKLKKKMLFENPEMAEVEVEVEEEEEGDDSSLDLTYVVHLSVDDVAINDWMKNRTQLDEHIVNPDLPFDYILVTSGLHDVGHFHTTTQFEHALRNVFVPSLLKLVRSPNDIVWIGSWSAQEAKKPKKYLPQSNNVRGFAFDDKAKSVLEDMGIPNWISSRYMTLPRDDLCKDSTHYSWPVTFASLELWLGTLCKAVDAASEQPC